MQSAVQRYYNINKMFLSKIGGWPTQSKFMKILLPTIITSFIFSIGFLEFIKMSEIGSNNTLDCESFIILMITCGGYAKLFAIILNDKNIERLLSLIDYHWRVYTHSLEIAIMHEYALVGRKITISYAVIVYTLMSLYMLIPVSPQILDLAKPLNKSRPYKFLFDIEYSFGREEHYYITLIHAYLTTVMCISVMVIVDTTYMMFAQHACSLFAAIGHRLENLILEVNLKKRNQYTKNIEMIYDKCKLVDYVEYNKDDEVYRQLILIIQKHQLSIEYVHLLDSSFALSSLLLVFITIFIISLIGIHILSLMNHKEEMIRYVSIGIGGFIHLFVLSYPGQRIMDHSVDIFHKSYNMEWYKLSKRSTQLLRILFYRSFVPCTLTACKIVVLSMANYASMVQKCISYFTAFSSLK